MRDDEEIERELRFHVDQRTADLVAAGLDPDAAWRQARLEFGGLTQTRDACHDVRRHRLWDGVAQDVRHALRIFRKAPGFAVVALITLALGIGSTTAVFGIIEAVLLRPLPFQQPDRLVAIWSGHVREKNLAKVFALYEDFETWARESRSFEQLAAATWATGDQILSGRGPARVVLAIPVSIDFFRLLGASPLLGRTFDRADLNGGCTVVVAHRFWEEMSASPNDLIGRALALDGRACTVIGVMPAQFAFYPETADMWTLITPNREQLPAGAGVGVFGRLRPGVTIESAQMELSALNQRTHTSDPDGALFVPTVYALRSEFTWLAGRNLRLTLLVLSFAVAAVLLIACVNVANLLLGRGLVRQREFAVRAALGSGRWRVWRQVVTEGLLLASAGAGLGIVLAVVLVRYFRAAGPIDLPPGTIVAVNGVVLAFAVSLAVATALLFAVIPAWRASVVDVRGLLQATSRALVGRSGGNRVATALVIVEITSATVLLVSAGLLMQIVARLGAAPLGFRTDGIVTMTIKLPKTTYATPQQRAAFYQRFDANVRLAPDPTMNPNGSVAMATTLVRGRSTNFLTIEGRPRPTAQTSLPDVGQDIISPDYFRVMEVPLRRGRSFAAGDRMDRALVAIVNEALVDRYFAGMDAIGQHIIYGNPRDNAPWMTIVGVVANQKGKIVYQEMGWVDTPMVFRPVMQVPPPEVTAIVRAGVSPAEAGGTIQRLLARLDPDVPVSDVQTMEERISKDLAYPQFRAAVLGGFAVVALGLALVGLYAVLSTLVAQRTHEIGVRMALGAPRGRVLALVLVQGLPAVAVGVTGGLAVAAALTRYLRSMLFGLTPLDPATFILTAIVLTCVAALACYLPARRATVVDPLIALRCE